MSWTYSSYFGWSCQQEATPDGLRWVVRDPAGTKVAVARTLRRALEWALQQRPPGWVPRSTTKGANDGT